MNGATFGDVHQPLPLTVVQVAGQLDLAIDMVDETDAGFAVGAVSCVNAGVPQRHSDPLEWPALAVGVHPYGHRGT